MVDLAAIVEGRVKGYPELWPDGQQPKGIAEERRGDYVDQDMADQKALRETDSYKEMRQADRYHL